MTIGFVLLLIAFFWVLLGLVGAWICAEFGRSGWRWVLLCAIAGPLSVSFVYDQLYVTDRDAADTRSDPSAPADRARVVGDDESGSTAVAPAKQSGDDPQRRLVLQGQEPEVRAGS